MYDQPQNENSYEEERVEGSEPKVGAGAGGESLEGAKSDASFPVLASDPVMAMPPCAGPTSSMSSSEKP